jgi:hypothetical protein
MDNEEWITYNGEPAALFIIHYPFRWWLRRESNPDLAFRKRLFYPLNYSARVNFKPRKGLTGDVKSLRDYAKLSKKGQFSN